MPANTIPRPESANLRATSHVAQVGDVLGLLAELVPNASDAERRSFARSFCYVVLCAWWGATREDAPDIAPCPILLDEPGHETWARAHAIGLELASLSRPLGTYLLSTLYAGLLPEAQRADEGVYYTPPVLVERLLDLAEEAGADWRQHRVLDPAAGSGAFLAAVAERVAVSLVKEARSSSEILGHVAQHLRGVELDPFSAWMGHVFVEAALWEHCVGTRTRLPVLVREQDALALPDCWSGGFDLIVGNPPYGRITLDPPTRKRFARSLYGHANLYGLFTDLSLRLCRPGGIVALVTPASFLGGQYFKRLRGVLLSEATPTAIDFVSGRAGVFDEVLQETVLLVLSRAVYSPTISVRTARPGSIAGSCRTLEIGRVDLPHEGDSPWILPRSRGDAALLDRVRSMPHRLRDYGLQVSTGPLVWNRHKAQLSSRRTAGCYPLVWAESVLGSGDFRFRAERRNHQPYFRLLPGQGHLLVSTPVVLLQRTTAKEQNRRLVAAVLPKAFLDEHGGAVIENHLNMVRPNGVRARVPLDAVAALLNSEVVDTIFRCTNGSVAVSAYELESIPVPPPEAMHQLHILLEGRATAASVESFLRQAYGQASEAAA